MHPFDYICAKSIDEAADVLSHDSEARVLAGGMSLIPVLRLRLGSATSLVDLNQIPGLRSIVALDDYVEIGSMTTHCAVASSDVVRKHIPALAALASKIGDPLVRNRGTIGGSLAHNDPAACYPCALLALGGVVITNRRAIDSDKFISATYETILEQGEIITAVRLRIPKRSAHIKFSSPASRLNIAGVFVAEHENSVRVGITGAGHYAFRAAEFEKSLTEVLDPRAIENLEISPKQLSSDMHASAEYRSHLVKELTKRAVQSLLLQ